jgi:7,8-dihydro-6-hydroxymethylpterin dimethyltransferase
MATGSFGSAVGGAARQGLGATRRLAERALVTGAKRLWPAVRWANERLPGRALHPAWAPRPLERRAEKTSPQLGWPRRTDSLCPTCVREARAEVLSGERDLAALIDGRPGEIEAHIVERDGKVMMVKDCPTHGRFEDVMAIDPAFLRRIEGLYPGRDFLADPTPLRAHGSSSIKYGRGAVLTVDLTNRCNMMCDPCFMDANQVGYVHELSLDEIRKILDDALSIKPRRQLSVQFSGGEPTLSPHFLDSVRYAREKGYFAVQCATNGIRFAQDAAFAVEAREAGLRMAYLQFDGVTNEANAHRKVGNLFDVKLRAIEHLHRAGIDVILVVTVVNGVNNDQVGAIVDFAVANADKITVVSFQPVSFTGRDEEVTPEVRARQRYTLSHLAHDVKAQTGQTEPLRDWFPLSAMGPFSDLVDQMLGESANMGALSCGCHPDCGVGTVLLVNKRTGRVVPMGQLLDLEALLRDVKTIADGSRGKPVSLAQLSLALLKSYRPEGAPEGYDIAELVRQCVSMMGARGERIGEFERDAVEFEWRVLFVAGMWFQDLFNYDFRRTEMCIIPYGTQLGEISFCAYNTGVGFRQVLEKMKANATVAEWYREQGRHPVYAKGQALPLPGDVPITSRLPHPPHPTSDAGAPARRRLPLL